MQAFIPSLHGLRGIAALGVLLFHWATFFPAMMKSLAAVPFAGTTWNLGVPFAFGWLGVHLFYVLSGYLLASQLASRPLTTRRVASFWLRRIARIYPAVWFQLAVLSGLLLAGVTALPDFSVRQFLFNIALWINMPPAMVRPINSVYWTLPIELSFYVTLPLIVWLLGRIRLVWLCAAAFAIAIAWRWAVLAAYQGEDFTAHLPILDALPGSLLSFMAGVALSTVAPASSRGLQRLLLVLITAGLWAMQRWLLGNLESYWRGDWTLLVWTPAAAILIALAVYALLQPPPECAFLASRPFVWLGEVSYGIYLWHLPVMLVLREAAGSMADSPAGSAAALGACLAATLALAALSYHVVELPAIRLARRRTGATGSEPRAGDG